MSKKLQLGIRESAFGGASVDAFLTIEDGIVKSIEYTNDEIGNLAWSQGPGWADELIGEPENSIQEFIDTFFDDFEDEYREPVVRSWPV